MSFVFFAHFFALTVMVCMASLVNKSFCSWNKFHEKCKNHGSSKIHHQSMLAAETFVNSIQHPETGLMGTMDAKRRANIG